MPVKDYIFDIADIVMEIGLLVLLIFMPLAYGSVEIWSQAIFELGVLFIFIIWVLKICISGKLTIHRSTLDIPIIIFFILAIFSRSISIYPHMSQMALYRMIAYIILYYIIINNFVSFSKLKRLSLYVIGSATIISFIGIIGYFNKNLLSSIWPYAIFSTFTTTSHFAGYIGMVFPLSLALLVDRNIGKKIYFILASVLIASVALLCQDRGGWVQFISATIFLIISLKYSGLLKRRGFFLLFIGTIFIWAISFYGFGAIIQRLVPLFTLQFRASPEATIWERCIYWQDTIKIIKSNPIFGTGIGTFSVAYPQFRSPEVVNLLNYAHQDFLQLASEMGLVGLGVFGWILFCLFKLGFNLIKNNIASYQKAQIIGSLSGVFGLLVYSFYDFNLHIPGNVVVFVILIAMVPISFYLLSLESNIKNKFWINLKLNLPLRASILFIAAYFISFMAISLIKPYLAHLHYEKGQVFEENLEWDRTIEEYNKAKELDPKDSTYYQALGNIYAARAHFDFLDKEYAELAISNYNRAIRLNPYQGEYYFTLANLYNILGYKELAQENLNKAISLDPNNNVYRQAMR